MRKQFETEFIFLRTRNRSNPQNTKNTTKFVPKSPPSTNNYEKTNKKGGKKKESNLPKPPSSFSFFRPLLSSPLTNIYLKKHYLRDFSVLFLHSLERWNSRKKFYNLSRITLHGDAELSFMNFFRKL